VYLSVILFVSIFCQEIGWEYHFHDIFRVEEFPLQKPV